MSASVRFAYSRVALVASSGQFTSSRRTEMRGVMPVPPPTMARWEMPGRPPRGYLKYPAGPFMSREAPMGRESMWRDMTPSG